MNNFKDEDFDDKIKNEEISVIQFSASWCMPCKNLIPIMNKFSDEYKHVQITLKITDERIDLKSPNNWLDGKQFIILDTKLNYTLAQKVNDGFENFIRLAGEDNPEYSYVQNIAGNSLAIDAGTCTKF